MKRRTQVLFAFGFLLVAGAGALAVRSSLRKAQALRQAQTMQAADIERHKGWDRSVRVASTDLQADGQWSAALTCRGSGQSPGITWSNVPAGTQSYVLTMVDWDFPAPSAPAAAFTHWMLYNIGAQRSGIAAGVSERELRQGGIDPGANSLGTLTYLGLCPPAPHRYRIRLYALDVAQIHPATPDRAAVAAAIDGHVLAYGELEGRFGN